jgi:hypothetical protein
MSTLLVLFIGAQEICSLACELCTNGWEKGHMPFVKVVEGWLVYNFPIYHWDHFSSKIWRKTGSNRAKWNPNRAVAPGVRAHVRRHARGHAGPNRRLTGHDRRSTPATAGPKALHRRSHPTLHRHARTLTGRAKLTCADRPTASPPYPGPARARRRPVCRTPAIPRPTSRLASTWYPSYASTASSRP